MTIEQMVEVPANHRLVLDLPLEIPMGTTAMVNISIPEFSAKKAGGRVHKITKELRELCQDSGLTVEHFLELRRKDLELEEEKYLRLFRKNGAGD